MGSCFAREIRKSLIKEGYAEELVDSMPVAQVLLIYAKRTYESLLDDVFKWFVICTFFDSGNFIDDIHAFVDLSKDGMHPV